MDAKSRQSGRAERNERSPNWTGHPALELLEQYWQKRASGAAAEAIQDHLASCSECTQLLLNLSAFHSADAEPASLAAAREATLLARVVIARRRIDRWRSFSAIAASLAIVGFGVLAYREITARDRALQVAETTPVQGDANLPLASLFPKGGGRGPEINRIKIPPKATMLAVVLAVREPPNYPDYRVEIRDADGLIRFSTHGLRPTDTGMFCLWAPASHLAASTYQVVLSGEDHQGSHPIETYVLLVERPAPGSPDQQKGTTDREDPP